MGANELPCLVFDVGVEGAGDDALEEFFTPLGGLPLVTELWASARS